MAICWNNKGMDRLSEHFEIELADLAMNDHELIRRHIWAAILGEQFIWDSDDLWQSVKKALIIMHCHQQM